MQKGIDLIADTFPAILEQNSKVQLICIGPVIDLYGKFAASKLQRLMELHPSRVCSKPEFTVLPPYIFSGAEFALIPSRDEPFGLVAVEFGRKGALGVGSRVGGLGTMPGWWFTIESVATKHLLRQFRRTIKAALASSRETRAEMRARSSLQRFPVVQWLEGLEKLQSGSIDMHARVSTSRASTASSVSTPVIASPIQSIPGSSLVLPIHTRSSSRMESRFTSRQGSGAASPHHGQPQEGIPNVPNLQDALTRLRRPGRATEPSSLASTANSATTSVVVSLFDTSSISLATDTPTAEPSTGHTLHTVLSVGAEQNSEFVAGSDLRRSVGRASVSRHMSRQNSQDSSLSISSSGGRHSPPRSARKIDRGSFDTASPSSLNAWPSPLSMRSVVGANQSYRMQKVDPFFTDSHGVYTKQFKRLLNGLNGRTSTNELCIEEFLIKSEKNWFGRFYDAKLGVKGSSSKIANVQTDDLSIGQSGSSGSIQVGAVIKDEFELGTDYVPPKGLKKIIQYKIRDWPMYSFFIALGQILSANSYQITLLSGEIGQTASRLYTIASIYLAASIIWWMLFRSMQSRYVITLPFVCYGLAFFILGMAPYGNSIASRGWIQNVATGLYAFASGSGSLFFALNFGSEGGTAAHTWVFRACMIQGTQQIYVTVLWYWGSHLSALSASGRNPGGFATNPYATAATAPIAILLALIGGSLYLGLPDFYRQSPGRVPFFYQSLRRRKIILWFFVVVIIQNYFLSAPYGRNWQYLWSSDLVPAWNIAILVLAFFIFVWIAVFTVFQHLSIEHSWILPIFAIGLGAPRWAQILWGTSGMGSFIPWAASPAIGALFGRALWLWLGILDALQGVGFGMILLQTMTRFHVAFTLTAAQVVGSIATIIARATAPDSLGPGTVFPNLALSLNGLGNAAFWVSLVLQCLVCVGFFAFFRKEQLLKP